MVDWWLARRDGLPILTRAALAALATRTPRMGVEHGCGAWVWSMGTVLAPQRIGADRGAAVEPSVLVLCTGTCSTGCGRCF